MLRFYKENNYHRGFTLVEVAIVMVILGLILGLGIPMMRTLIKQNKLTEDRLAVKEAKNALIGYAYRHGMFPAPVTSGTYRLLPYDIIGTRQTDSHGNRLIYDVNDNLTASSDQSLQSFCNKVANEAIADHLPKIDNNGTKTPVAFIVISKGSNYRLDDLNATGAKVSGGTGIYDNPSHPYDNNYDDIVASYSFGELEKWCDETVGSGSGGSSGSYSTAYGALTAVAANLIDSNPNGPPDSFNTGNSAITYSKDDKKATLTYHGKAITIEWGGSGIDNIEYKGG